MIIALAGGNGFVGRQVQKKLIDSGNTVRILSTQHTDPVNTNVYVGNAITGQGIEEFVKDAQVIVNLIGRFTPPFLSQMETNVLGLHNLLKATNGNYQKVIHISAAAVYGGANTNPSETTAPRPDTQYSLTKLLGEEVLRYFSQQYERSWLILRPTNIYGPGAHSGVIYDMITSARKTHRIQVTGDGSQIRDFLHVDDMADAMYNAIISEDLQGVYNVSSGELFSIDDVARIIAKNMGEQIQITYTDKAFGFTQHLSADNAKMQKAMGWVPQKRLLEELPKIIPIV